MEGGSLAVSVEPTDLEAVLQSAIDLLETAFLARGIRLELGDRAAGVCVMADEVRLKQVFVNLLSNAIKYNKPSGSIFLHCHADAQIVSVTIRDEGQGVSCDRQSELFVPFHRMGAENTATEGVGLGLVISRHLIERQGGSLDFASAPGAGTAVTVHLTRALENCSHEGTPGETGAEIKETDRPKGVVLYIEDDPVNVLLMEQYVASCSDVKLVVATTGESGIALARTCSPRLIVLDMQLPDLTGLEVLSALRAMDATAGIRTIALSADAMPEQVAEALRRGVYAYWTKPLALRKFQDEFPALLNY